MDDYSQLFTKLSEEVNKAFTYTPLTDAQYQSSCVDDIIEYAEAIASEWNGDEPGSQEDRAHCANDIIAKCKEIKALLAEMDEL